MIVHGLLKDIERLTRVRVNEPLSRHTTFGIGGPADIYVVAESEESLCEMVRLAHQHGVPVFILGAGSNILVGDGGIRGMVIENNVASIQGPEPDGDDRYIARVGSGTSFASVSRRLSLAGWAGVEWAVGIPGTIGGAVIYNAGAYNRCTADVLISARTVDGDGRVRELAAADLKLAYRSSIFNRGQLPGHVVLSADLSLTKGDPKALADQIAKFDAHRLMAQPRGQNCGSIFKNPEGQSAWSLVDRVGLRGHRIGNAQISQIHTNFILNLGRASAADVMALIRLAQERAWSEFNVKLETEVSLVGEGFSER